MKLFENVSSIFRYIFFLNMDLDLRFRYVYVKHVVCQLLDQISVSNGNNSPF